MKNGFEKHLLRGCFSLLIILGCHTASAQSFEWKANAYGFFDNSEYGSIPGIRSQTMSGFRISPEVGFRYKDISLFAGVHLQTEFGSPKFLDYTYFTGYFQYKTPHHHFLFGAFPREHLLDNYSDFFIRDTFSYYRPNITGLFYKLSGENNFISLWIDWVGSQSPVTREMFFAGLSGEQRWNWFFLSLNGYYFHYANTRPTSGDGVVHDNGQGQVGVGIDFSHRAQHLHKMRLGAYFMMGYECKRDHTTPVKMPMGLVVDLHAQYWRIGTRTLYYYGQERFTVPTDYPPLTYWGTPLLRAKSYLESQWYISLFKNSIVEAKAAFVFHLQGAKFGCQQMVSLSVNLNGAVNGKKTMEDESIDRYSFNFLPADSSLKDEYGWGKKYEERRATSRSGDRKK